MQRAKSALSGILGSIGLALLVLGVVLVAQGFAVAKDESGNFSVCVLCTNNCSYLGPPVDGCTGTCDGFCNSACGCRPSVKVPQSCVCKTFP